MFLDVYWGKIGWYFLAFLVLGFFSHWLSLVGRRLSFWISTGCVVPLRQDWAFFCYTGSGRVGHVWSARKKAPEILHVWELNPGLEEDQQCDIFPQWLSQVSVWNIDLGPKRCSTTKSRKLDPVSWKNWPHGVQWWLNSTGYSTKNWRGGFCFLVFWSSLASHFWYSTCVVYHLNLNQAYDITVVEVPQKCCFVSTITFSQPQTLSHPLRTSLSCQQGSISTWLC